MNGANTSPNQINHLHQVELARRWKLSPRTLERWRWQGVGPCYLKLRGRVAYRLEDVEAFEAAQLRAGGTASALAGAVKVVSVDGRPLTSIHQQSA